MKSSSWLTKLKKRMTQTAGEEEKSRPEEKKDEAEKAPEAAPVVEEKIDLGIPR